MKKHIGSMIALTLGILVLVSGLTKPISSLLAGIFIILGALAYRSAKKRILEEVENTLLRKGLEVSALVIIATAVLLQNNLKSLIATDPVPNLVIPIWAIIAYIIIASKTKKVTEEVSPANKYD